MATRNGERFIRDQLESILCQLSPADEVVISDDSSTDRTVEIAAAFHDPRIRLLTGNRFFSPIYNFEHALSHATGDVIILADQDDVWLSGRVELIRERFSGRRALVHAIVMDGEVVDEAGTVTAPSIFALLHSGPGLFRNVWSNSYMGCAMAVSRELLERALPFPSRLPMHDVWLGLLAELFGTVEFVPVVTFRYRKHGESLTEFRRRFRPVTQISRRFWLVVRLVGRLVQKAAGKH
jgi:glycosyltransferase involved in cell wall biosynthesis